MNHVDVLKPGSAVTLWGNVAARIDTVCIESGRVYYRVKYWCGGTLNDTAVAPELVEPGAGDIVKIGFRE